MNNINNNNQNVIIRLYLIRHGETIANLHNNVIGQTDSPLTELGKQQAMALGKWLAISNPFITPSSQQQQGEEQVEQTSSSSSMVTNRHDYFWRIYSSDLGRTKHTTQLILQQYYTYNIHNNNHNHYNHHTIPTIPTTPTNVVNESISVDYNNNNVFYDSRLREIARGVRQGLSKQFTYNDAMKTYNDGLHPIYNNMNNNNNNNTLPLNESDDDGWDRIYTLWLNDLVHDIQKDVIISQTQPPITNTNTTTTIQQQEEIEEEEKSKYYNILVVTHGALLRVFLNRLLGTDRIQKECNQNGINHNSNNNDTNLKWLDETQQRTNTVSPAVPTTTSSSFVRLHVPNTSLTIIDIANTATSVSTTIPNITYPNNENSITVQRFLSTEHYQLINKC